MNPLSVHAENYRSFESLDLEIPAGCCAIIGENGAGKSSIVNLIDLCLFGPQSRSLAEYLRDDAFEEEMVLALEFQHAGETYRVRRTFSGRGRGKSALDFEQWVWESHSASWQPLTREDQKQTQALIETTIGLSRETFRASAFLAQGDGAAFTEAQPRDRKRILGEVLGLDVWERLLAKARYERGEEEALAGRLQTQIEGAEQELERKPDVAASVETAMRETTEAHAAVVNAEKTHRGATERLNQSREVAAKLTAAKEVLAARERELQQLTERRATVQHALAGADELPTLRANSLKLVDRKPEIERQLAAAREAEAARAEHQRLTKDRDRLVDAANELREKEAALHGKATEIEQGVAERCDRCDQPLQHEAREHAVKSMKAEALQHHLQAKDLEGQADHLLVAIELAGETSARIPNTGDQAKLEADLRVAGEAERVLAGLDEREKRVEELKTERGQIEAKRPEAERLIAESRTAVAELEDEAPKEDLEAAVARAYGVLVEARSDIEGAKQRLAVAEAELQRLRALETQTAANRMALGEHQAQLDLLHLAERAYGQNGIPALIIENAAIPQIEVEASRILGELGTEFRVELRTQREKKTGGISDTLDIVILSAGGERLYESLSGGERSRVNVALRIGLARLLAHRRGAESRVLVLDEVEYLDEPGQEALANVLRGLAGDFDTVILVSHVPGLRDVFDTTITVAKEDGRSVIAPEAALVEVTA